MINVNPDNVFLMITFDNVNIFTFYCLLQFVVQLLLLIGEVGDITGQGPIGFLQLHGVGNTVIFTVVWVTMSCLSCLSCLPLPAVVQPEVSSPFS